MIDHLGINVADFDASKAFYDKAMAPLGASLLYMVPRGIHRRRQGRRLWPRPAGVLAERRQGRAAGTTSMSPSPRAAAPRSMPSMPRPLPPAARTMAGRACARTITRTITAPSSSIPTATMSRPSAMPRSEERHDEPRQSADLHRRLPVRRRALPRRGHARRRLDLPLPHVPEGVRQLLRCRWSRCAAPSSTGRAASRNISARPSRVGVASAAIAARR